RHTVLGPWRIERQLQLNVRNPWHGAHGAFHLGRQCPGHRAIRRRQRHADPGAAFGIHIGLINQTQLVDVDGHLRVIDLPQRGDHLIFESHSVLTGSEAAPVSADFKVCHARVAHLTRAGYSRTPQNTTSFPRSLLTAESVVRSSWNFSRSWSASARV